MMKEEHLPENDEALVGGTRRGTSSSCSTPPPPVITCPAGRSGGGGGGRPPRHSHHSHRRNQHHHRGSKGSGGGGSCDVPKRASARSELLFRVSIKNPSTAAAAAAAERRRERRRRRRRNRHSSRKHGGGLEGKDGPALLIPQPQEPSSPPPHHRREDDERDDGEGGVDGAGSGRAEEDSRRDDAAEGDEGAAADLRDDDGGGEAAVTDAARWESQTRDMLLREAKVTAPLGMEIDLAGGDQELYRLSQLRQKRRALSDPVVRRFVKRVCDFLAKKQRVGGKVGAGDSHDQDSFLAPTLSPPEDDLMMKVEERIGRASSSPTIKIDTNGQSVENFLRSLNSNDGSAASKSSPSAGKGDSKGGEGGTEKEGAPDEAEKEGELSASLPSVHENPLYGYIVRRPSQSLLCSWSPERSLASGKRCSSNHGDGEPSASASSAPSSAPSQPSEPANPPNEIQHANTASLMMMNRTAVSSMSSTYYSGESDDDDDDGDDDIVNIDGEDDKEEEEEEEEAGIAIKVSSSLVAGTVDEDSAVEVQSSAMTSTGQNHHQQQQQQQEEEEQKAETESAATASEKDEIGLESSSVQSSAMMSPSAQQQQIKSSGSLSSFLRIGSYRRSSRSSSCGGSRGSSRRERLDRKKRSTGGESVCSSFHALSGGGEEPLALFGRDRLGEDDALASSPPTGHSQLQLVRMLSTQSSNDSSRNISCLQSSGRSQQKKGDSCTARQGEGGLLSPAAISASRSSQWGEAGLPSNGPKKEAGITDVKSLYSEEGTPERPLGRKVSSGDDGSSLSRIFRSVLCSQSGELSKKGQQQLVETCIVEVASESDVESETPCSKAVGKYLQTEFVDVADGNAPPGNTRDGIVSTKAVDAKTKLQEDNSLHIDGQSSPNSAGLQAEPTGLPSPSTQVETTPPEHDETKVLVTPSVRDEASNSGKDATSINAGGKPDPRTAGSEARSITVSRAAKSPVIDKKVGRKVRPPPKHPVSENNEEGVSALYQLISSFVGASTLACGPEVPTKMKTHKDQLSNTRPGKEDTFDPRAQAAVCRNIQDIPTNLNSTSTSSNECPNQQLQEQAAVTQCADDAFDAQSLDVKDDGIVLGVNNEEIVSRSSIKVGCVAPALLPFLLFRRKKKETERSPSISTLSSDQNDSEKAMINPVGINACLPYAPTKKLVRSKIRDEKQDQRANETTGSNTIEHDVGDTIKPEPSKNNGSQRDSSEKKNAGRFTFFRNFSRISQKSANTRSTVDEVQPLEKPSPSLSDLEPVLSMKSTPSSHFDAISRRGAEQTDLGTEARSLRSQEHSKKAHNNKTAAQIDFSKKNDTRIRKLEETVTSPLQVTKTTPQSLPIAHMDSIKMKASTRGAREGPVGAPSGTNINASLQESFTERGSFDDWIKTIYHRSRAFRTPVTSMTSAGNLPLDDRLDGELSETGSMCLIPPGPISKVEHMETKEGTESGSFSIYPKDVKEQFQCVNREESSELGTSSSFSLGLTEQLEQVDEDDDYSHALSDLDVGKMKVVFDMKVLDMLSTNEPTEDEGSKNELYSQSLKVARDLEGITSKTHLLNIKEPSDDEGSKNELYARGLKLARDLEEIKRETENRKVKASANSGKPPLFSRFFRKGKNKSEKASNVQASETSRRNKAKDSLINQEESAKPEVSISGEYRIVPALGTSKENIRSAISVSEPPNQFIEDKNVALSKVYSFPLVGFFSVPLDQSDVVSIHSEDPSVLLSDKPSTDSIRISPAVGKAGDHQEARKVKNIDSERDKKVNAKSGGIDSCNDSRASRKIQSSQQQNGGKQVLGEKPAESGRTGPNNADQHEGAENEVPLLGFLRRIGEQFYVDPLSSPSFGALDSFSGTSAACREFEKSKKKEEVTEKEAAATWSCLGNAAGSEAPAQTDSTFLSALSAMGMYSSVHCAIGKKKKQDASECRAPANQWEVPFSEMVGRIGDIFSADPWSLPNFGEITRCTSPKKKHEGVGGVGGGEGERRDDSHLRHPYEMRRSRTASSRRSLSSNRSSQSTNSKRSSR